MVRVRKWGPKVKEVQEAIVAAIEAERSETLGDLPPGLQGDHFHVGVAVNPDRAPARAYTIQVMPPADSEWDAEVTDGFEGQLSFPLLLRVKALDEAGMALMLRDMVGLVVDAIATDITLGGKVGGTASPAFTAGAIEVGTGEMEQQLHVRLVARA